MSPLSSTPNIINAMDPSERLPTTSYNSETISSNEKQRRDRTPNESIPKITAFNNNDDSINNIMNLNSKLNLHSTSQGHSDKAYAEKYNTDRKSIPTTNSKSHISPQLTPTTESETADCVDGQQPSTSSADTDIKDFSHYSSKQTDDGSFDTQASNSTPSRSPCSSFSITPNQNGDNADSNNSTGYIDVVVALYDYISDKPHSLAFKKGDIINVLLKLDSGWWDGVLKSGARGWFPSNYTEKIQISFDIDPQLTLTSPEYTQNRNPLANPSLNRHPQSNYSLSQANPIKSSSFNSPFLVKGLYPTHASRSRDSSVSTPSRQIEGPNSISSSILDINMDLYDSMSFPAGSRKNSVASCTLTDESMAPLSRINSNHSVSERKPSEDLTCKFTTQAALAKSTEPSTWWVPQTTKAGDLFFYNKPTNTYCSTMPFEPANKQTEMLPINGNRFETSAFDEPPAHIVAASNDTTPTNFDNLTPPCVSTEDLLVSGNTSTMDPNAHRKLSMGKIMPNQLDFIKPRSTGSSRVNSDASNIDIPQYRSLSLPARSFSIFSTTDSLSLIHEIDEDLSTVSWNTLNQRFVKDMHALLNCIQEDNAQGFGIQMDKVSYDVDVICGKAHPSHNNSLVNTFPDLVVLFRQIMTRLSKLGISGDMCLSSRLPSCSQSLCDSSGSQNAITTPVIKSPITVFSDFYKNSRVCERCLNESDWLLYYIDSFIDIVQNFDLMNETKNIISKSNSEQEKTDGASTNLSHTDKKNQILWSRAYTEPSANEVQAQGPESSTASQNYNNKLYMCTAGTVRFDTALINTIGNQRSMIQGLSKNIINMMETSKLEDYSQKETGLLPLFEASIKCVIDGSGSLLDLLENIDLGVFQMRKKSNVLDTEAGTKVSATYNYLGTLYEFLESKNTLYNSLSLLKVAFDGFSDATNEAPSEINSSKHLANWDMLRESVSLLDSSLENLVVSTSLLCDEQEALINFATRALGNQYFEPNVYVTHNYNFELQPHSSRSSYMDSKSTSPVASAATSVVNLRNNKAEERQSSLSASSNTSRGDSDAGLWFIKSEHEKYLLFDAKGNVKAGTEIALVERLTHHAMFDAMFNSAFLMTYRSFMTSRSLFDQLVNRFTIQPPDGLSPEDFEVWCKQKQKPIRLRVINIFKSWLESYWFEQIPNEPLNADTIALLKSIRAFAQQLASKKFPGSQALLILAEGRIEGKDVSKKMVPNVGNSPPPSVMPSGRKPRMYRTMDFDPVELARQLTIREATLYQNIPVIECLNRSWNNKRKPKNDSKQSLSAKSAGAETATPPPESISHIRRFIQNSNQLTDWVAFMILKQQDAKKRVYAIKYFVVVAENCRKNNNFSSMTSIISALYSSTIHRLNRTWEQVPAKTMLILENMNKLMNSTRNFNEYRDVLRLTPPPVVPFFGVYLADLTFVKDGNPDYFKNDSRMINMAKHLKTAEIIREIRYYQSVSYNLINLADLQEMLTQNLAEAPPIEELYDLSLIIEPKEKTNHSNNDRIQRLLQENAQDLLHPSQESELRKHKLKTLVQSPRSYFMDVKCPGCLNITTVFSHAQTVVSCGDCTQVLCTPTGGKAKLTEGSSFRRK
ncbi:ras GEF [Nadsonia fulvescens var. elongata DSM 6958]|uniref:Ras GEF n=1 Tax=Nadsonia fulvescens var. elongata DSM 6958 TaxID=857566 RepID=A0A1E3PU83_9ASCO|nr:ras GEF [Nadsonia fulvescens var. elongata DSM 6958]